MKRLILLLFILTTPALAFGQADEKPTVMEALESFEKATLERNADALSDCLHEKYQMISPRGMAITKDMLLTPFRDANRKSDLVAIESTGHEISIMDKTAVVLANVRHQFKEESGKPEVNYRMTYVLKKSGAKWLMVLSQGIRK